MLGGDELGEVLGGDWAPRTAVDVVQEIRAELCFATPVEAALGVGSELDRPNGRLEHMDATVGDVDVAGASVAAVLGCVLDGGLDVHGVLITWPPTSGTM